MGVPVGGGADQVPKTFMGTEILFRKTSSEAFSRGGGQKKKKGLFKEESGSEEKNLAKEESLWFRHRDGEKAIPSERGLVGQGVLASRKGGPQGL